MTQAASPASVGGVWASQTAAIKLPPCLVSFLTHSYLHISSVPAVCTGTG